METIEKKEFDFSHVDNDLLLETIKTTGKEFFKKRHEAALEEAIKRKLIDEEILKGNFLSKDKKRYENKLKTEIEGFGLFRRVDTHNFLSYILTPIIAAPIAFIILLIAALIISIFKDSVNMFEGYVMLKLIVIVISIGAGHRIAGEIFRKNKEISTEFGIIVTSESIHFVKWWFAFNKINFDKPLYSLPKKSVQISPIILNGKKGISIAINDKFIIYALVLSIVPADNTITPLIIEEDTNNSVYKIFNTKQIK